MEAGCSLASAMSSNKGAEMIKSFHRYLLSLFQQGGSVTSKNLAPSHKKRNPLLNSFRQFYFAALRNNLQLFSYFDKRCDGLVEVCLRVRCGDLRADARLPLCYYRVKEPDCINAFFEQAVGKFL